MQRNCKASGQPFEVTPDDLRFYEKMGVPPPQLCPEEDARNRFAWRNERNLFVRKCTGTGQQIVSIYSSEKPFPVFDQHYYWSDKWDAMEYGRDFDFSRTFFDQYRELLLLVPRISIINKDGINSDYCNYSQKNKNCYLTFCSHFNEDLLYIHDATRSRDSADSLRIQDSELCYENVDCEGCYNLRFGQNCYSCSDSWYLKNCIGCKNCFGCVNLRNKEYYFLNEACSKTEYLEKLASFDPYSYRSLEKMCAEFDIFEKSFPNKFAEMTQTENCTGNYIVQSKNCIDCYETSRCEDCYRMRLSDDTYDSRDLDHMGFDRSECCYHVTGCSATYDCICSESCWHNRNIAYCGLCFHNHDLFGCISLRHKQFCILNKQYSKEEYFKLRERIIEHMKNSGEWGEFFPVGLSPFAYNETVAQEYFPLAKEGAIAKGWKWRDETNEIPQVEKIIPAHLLLDSVDDIPDDILNWAIECEETGKPFIIQKPELDFYRKMRLPIPHFHPDVRHAHRLAKRNPQKLWKRNCDNCGKPIETSYSPDKPEKVYCEECYQKSVY